MVQYTIGEVLNVAGDWKPQIKLKAMRYSKDRNEQLQ